jgi:hypothetical protein
MTTHGTLRIGPLPGASSARIRGFALGALEREVLAAIPCRGGHAVSRWIVVGILLDGSIACVRQVQRF